MTLLLIILLSEVAGMAIAAGPRGAVAPTTGAVALD
jgi:hypothetical protein